jgi:hypothetical protein
MLHHNKCFMDFKHLACQHYSAVILSRKVIKALITYSSRFLNHNTRNAENKLWIQWTSETADHEKKSFNLLLYFLLHFLYYSQLSIASEFIFRKYYRIDSEREKICGTLMFTVIKCWRKFKNNSTQATTSIKIRFKCLKKKFFFLPKLVQLLSFIACLMRLQFMEFRLNFFFVVVHEINLCEPKKEKHIVGN